MTCELFGYQKDELSGMKVQSLFTEPYRAKQQALVEQNIDASGATVLISGKVVSVGDIHCNEVFNLVSEEPFH
jgi:PAS domain S-box-containing protein